MKRIFLNITYILLFLFCSNITYGQKTDSIHKKSLILNSYIQTYQTVQFRNEDAVAINYGFKFYNAYYGLLLSLSICNTSEYYKQNLFPEIVSGYLINPQNYWGSVSDQSVIPGYKFNFSCVPLFLKLNFIKKKQNKYYISFGLVKYYPLFKKEMYDYDNLNHFDYKSQEKLFSFHLEIGLNKIINKRLSINAGGILQIFPSVKKKYWHGLSEEKLTPFSINPGIAINFSYVLINKKK